MQMTECKFRKGQRYKYIIIIMHKILKKAKGVPVLYNACMRHWAAALKVCTYQE